jgi:hypothetical protein
MKQMQKYTASSEIKTATSDTKQIYPSKMCKTNKRHKPSPYTNPDVTKADQAKTVTHAVDAESRVKDARDIAKDLLQASPNEMGLQPACLYLNCLL